MINLVMALHCHQPLGNFDDVIAKAHEQCYYPILDLLDQHPTVRLGMHFSGCLLEWLDRHKPGTLDLLAKLVQRGQVEPISGGFFEPLLATIPAGDARGQVQMLNDFLTRRLGQTPTGFWLTERIWDANLPATLAGTGMEYTIVDDTHLYYAGLNPDDVFGMYLTEKHSHPLKILATPMTMRYLIPFRQITEVLEQLRTWDRDGRGVAIYGDDGEKFGVWPETYEWIIQKGWLKDFFQAIEENSDWLQTMTPGQYAASAHPRGRLYLPPASYEEMTEWALPPARAQALEDIIETLKEENRWENWRPFVRGGIWDNFLVKYDETNRMHKKMLYLSQRAGDNPKAREHVWRAQCNCGYWHGIFGGLYYGFLRRAIYENLLLAQAELIKTGGGALQVRQLDLDIDGQDEILIESPSLSLGLAPARGGSLFELSHLGRALNLMDVLTRRPEAYHRRLQNRPASTAGEGQVASIHDQVKVKEEGLERLLKYDPYTKLSLLDHFWSQELTADRLLFGDVPEIGDFLTGAYDLSALETTATAFSAKMSRSGQVAGATFKVAKSVRGGRGPAFSVTYQFENLEPRPLNVWFGCEFNLTLYSAQDSGRYLMAVEHGRRREVYETGTEYGLTRLDLINGGDRLKTAFRFSRPVDLAFYPLWTVSMSEDGFERTYQGTCLVFLHRLDLEPAGKTELRLDLELIAT